MITIILHAICVVAGSINLIHVIITQGLHPKSMRNNATVFIFSTIVYILYAMEFGIWGGMYHMMINGIIIVGLTTLCTGVIYFILLIRRESATEE